MPTLSPVGEKKQYWDYQQCCWVPYDAAVVVPVPTEAPDDRVAQAEEADIVSG